MRQPIQRRVVSLVAVGLGLLAMPMQGVAAEKPQGEKTSTVASGITHADAEKASKLVDGKKVAVIDVRTADEFAGAHIAGATNIDFQSSDFEARLAALDKDKPYLVHCAAGGRSTRSLETFKKLGFKSVVHLDGGMNAWQKAKKPVEQGNGKAKE